jgi:hypothetical protein
MTTADVYIVNADGTNLIPLASGATNEFFGALID